MKVLLAHNHYRSSAPSGEDSVFHNECELLRAKGIEVTVFERFNDRIDVTTFSERVRVALNGAWSRQVYDDITRLLREVRPDIMHFHNTFPLISASGYAACQDNGVPVVQTLHNYRFICPGALLLRDGNPCEDCVGKTLLPALIHRCYRGSLAATAAQVWTITRNRLQGAHQNLVNRYIALSHFSVKRFVAGGLPEGRIEVKPNFLLDEDSIAGNGAGGYAVYVGRLSEEKGVRTLLDAWTKVNQLPLKILGDGPLRGELQNLARLNRLNIEFCGYKSHREVMDILSEATLQIVPSEWYEGFPMVILEAYRSGVPVVASRIGALEEIVLENETGIKFEPGNASDLAAKVNSLYARPERLRLMRRNAKEVFYQNYTAERNFSQLMRIYQHATEDFQACRAAV